MKLCDCFDNNCFPVQASKQHCEPPPAAAHENFRGAYVHRYLGNGLGLNICASLTGYRVH